jgi:hypothetical protein
MFCNSASFYFEKLSAPPPTPKQVDHPFFPLHNYLSNIFTATIHIGGCFSIRSPRTHHAVVTGAHLSWFEVMLVFKMRIFVTFILLLYGSLKNKNISKKLKLRLMNTLINKTLTYPSEMWTRTKRDRKQLNIFERKVYRRILVPVYDNDKEKWRVLTNKEIYASVEKLLQ